MDKLDTKHLHDISWSSGYEKHTEVEKKLKDIGNGVFCKKIIKSKVLSKTLESGVTKLMTTHTQKILNLIFKYEEYDWRFSSYPFRHPKTFHCAEN